MVSLWLHQEPIMRTAGPTFWHRSEGLHIAAGIKLVLPAILDGISDSAWRSKQGSMQLLGTTAHCAPQQLSVMLPKAVPVLTAALADPHPKVQDAAKKALEEVSRHSCSVCPIVKT